MSSLLLGFFTMTRNKGNVNPNETYRALGNYVTVSRGETRISQSESAGRHITRIATQCKNLGIDPQAYLRDVLDRISTHPASRIEELLPDRWQALRQAGARAQD